MDDYLLKCYLFVALSTFSRRHWRLCLKITVVLFCIYTILRRFYPLPIILMDYALESIGVFQGIVEPMLFIVCFSFEKAGIDPKLAAGICLLGSIVVFQKSFIIRLIKFTLLAYFVSTINFKK